MSTVLNHRGGGGGGGGREFFLSAHRCPEVDLLPHHDSETQFPPPCPLIPAEKISELPCTSQSEANYLDISSTRCSVEEAEEEEGSISDWSEEDLSLHFSPSVILPSDDEESDLEIGFKCVDINVEPLVKGQEGGGLKMVPKRQIQLKRKDAKNIINQEKPKKLQDGPAEEGVANCEVSANELLRPTVLHRPDLLLRQHSMPASLHTRSTTSSDADSYRIYRGLVAGASQGFQVGENSRQRLQKSFSLDETKTKMASCIIKSVLSKKMLVEQNNSKTSYLQRKPAVLPSLPQPADQQRVREGGGGKMGGGVFKGPVHVVRDMRSLVKNTYSLPFSTAPTTTTTENNKPANFKVIGQQDSPPPTYQQAVGVQDYDETKRSCQASGRHVTKVTASLSQSQDRKQSNRFSHPITQQRRGSDPIISRRRVDDVTWPVMLSDPPTNSCVSSDFSELSQSERAPSCLSVLMHPPPQPASTSRHLQGTPSLLSAQEQSSILGVPSQFALNSSQQILHSCFYTSTALPAFPLTLHPHLGKVSYVHSPLSYMETQLQPPQPVPTLHLPSRSEENQSGSTGNSFDQQDCFIKTCPPHQTRTAGDQQGNCNTVTPATQEQHEQQQRQQQHFVYGVQGFSPAQVGNDFVVDVTGSSAAPGALLSGPSLCHMMLKNPKSVGCFYVDTPPKAQRKMLLDPETGQYVWVFLPAARTTPNTAVFPVRFANPAPFVINHTPSTTNPAILSMMQFQPTVAVSSLYAAPCLPFTLHTPSVNFTHTAP
ncbi:uncharacterized protein prob1 [Dicentrarchus labrax]|uniref:uncharacterized protein prob1 n=1 Tax=Dicentrarchus labrax TaxID=13489 RepID=UPI0021F61F34|nr:uncharacterized protein prob1 [Dicentrarchus labrax]